MPILAGKSLLKLEGVHTFYGPVEALKGLNIEIKAGEIVSLIGSNGAGKSTTLMTISGVIRPQKGEIYFEGSLLNGLPPHKLVGLGISHVPEGRRIFPRLTVIENLELGAYALGAADQAQFEKIFGLFPILGERGKQMGGTLSGGEQQMLAIGRALMSNPRMLLLDEPSLGLAPIIVSRIFRTIKEINREGVTVLLVEQNAHAALGLSDRGYVLENGKVVLSGTGRELADSEQVKKAYLGE
jgi:branched-chain amino acid transport system ATP-binding protein